MKLTYKFVTGESLEIEVPEGIGEVGIELSQEMVNNNRRETCRHSSVEARQARGKQLADGGPDIPTMLEQYERSAALLNALNTLLPQQQALIQKVFFEERSISSLAREEGVNESAIRHRLRRIYKKLKIKLA